MASETAEDEGKVSSCGLHVVYGSRTRRGLAHANEDRHAVAHWTGWKNDAHLQSSDEFTDSQQQSYPVPHVLAPCCTGSARKDTTFCGVGSTGNAVNPLEMSNLYDGSNTPDAKNTGGTSSCDKTFLWTVCDGHDGPEAADFVCKNVGDCFSRIWHSPGSHKLPPNMSKDKKNLTEENKMYMRGYALSNSLARTFEALDNSFKNHVMNPDESSSSSRTQTCTAGSCVTSIFLTDNLMCCAGLGDCKAAILTLEEADTTPGAKSGDQSTTTEERQTGSSSSKPTQQFQVTWFSKEHRLSAPKERARIRARGGWFRHGRVGGVLEPTRTIGDFDIKASQPAGVVIATPEVRTFSVSKPALVCIASDGIWDFIDASQLLRTFKRRRRLWRGILSWLDACVQPKRGLMGFGFRRRAKSKEGLNLFTHMPTGGDLCALADTLVTRAHDLGSDDDCTCIVLYLRPGAQANPSAGVGDASSKKASDAGLEDQDLGEADQDINNQRRANCTPSNAPIQLEDDDDDEEEEEELEEEDDYENQEEPEYDAGMDSSFEYEKWRNPMEPADGDGAAEEVDDDWAAPPDVADANDEQEEEPETSQRPESKFGEVWDLSTATFPVTCQGMETVFPSNAVDIQDAPEVIEKARKRREERRAARERRKKSLEEEQLRKAVITNPSEPTFISNDTTTNIMSKALDSTNTNDSKQDSSTTKPTNL